MFDLVEDKDRERTIETLIKYLEETNYHLTTGFVGTPYLCHVLSTAGRIDAAYKLLMQEDYPSWLYQIHRGATTIWEHWDGIRPDGTFWSANMNSFNHYAYGAVGDWLYQVAAGIRVDETRPGYKNIIISPQPGNGSNLNKLSAALKTLYGLVSVKWSLVTINENDQSMEIDVEIPHNTNATLVLPGAECSKMQAGGNCIELGSGIYHYTYKYQSS